MISVGESTGALDSMLSKIADFYEEEVDVAVANLTSLLEPFLMIFLGVVIGGVVIAMYLPIFQMANAVGNQLNSSGIARSGWTRVSSALTWLHLTLSPRSPETLKTVKGLMLCRLIILTLLLTIILLPVSEKKYFFIPLTNTFYYFIGLFYLVTILYALFLKKVRTSSICPHPDRHRSPSSSLDSSILPEERKFFPDRLFLSIIGSSIFFYHRGAFFSASLCLLLSTDSFSCFSSTDGSSPPGVPSPYEASQIFYSLIIYLASFFIVAFLSGLIAEELRKKKKELIQKQDDYQPT